MRRRNGLIGGATLAALAAGALVLPRHGGLEAVQRTTPDSLYAMQAMDAARGVSPRACDMMMRWLGSGWWGSLNRQPDMHQEFLDQARWMAEPSSDGAAVGPLARGLQGSDVCVRRVAARLLGHIRHPTAAEALLAALGSADAATRAAAAVGLGYAKQRRTVPRLVAALEDPAPAVRAAAAWALGEIDDPQATPHLIQLLQRDRDPAVRRAAAWALGAMS